MNDKDKIITTFALLGRIAQGALARPGFMSRLKKKLSPGARDFLQFLTDMVNAIPYENGVPIFNEAAFYEFLNLHKVYVQEITKKGIVVSGKDISAAEWEHAALYLETEMASREAVH